MARLMTAAPTETQADILEKQTLVAHFATAEMRRKLEELDRISDEEWLDTLDTRKKKELKFFDQKQRARREGEAAGTDTFDKFYANHKYYRTTELSRRYVREWVEKHARGKIFLDLACGEGTVAIQAAKAGARLAIGIDISRVSIENARQDAAAHGVTENTFFVQGDAENTKLPDCSIDAVMCSGMLHHLDLSYVFPELRRILAPGGRGSGARGS